MATNCLLILALPAGLSGEPFALGDSGPGSPDFRERFLASYGVNSAIEPTISAEERPLYEQIAPYLRDDPERAIREVEAALEDDSNPAFRFLLGNLYYQTERYPDAERYLREAIDAFPDFRRAYRTLGIIFIQDERYEEAIEAWLKVITLGGGDAQSYGLLGYAYLSGEKYDSALSAYQMARMFKPDSEDFRRGQAECLLRTNQSLRAVALFEELIAEDPSVGDYWLLQANAFLKLERYDEAIANLELVHSFGQGTLSSRLLLGDLHLQAGNHTLALDHYTQALSETDDWDVGQALQPLQYLMARRLFEEAGQYLNLLKSRLSKSIEEAHAEDLALAEARIGFQSGRIGEALSALEPIVVSDPLHGEALLLIAEIHQEKGDIEQCEFYLQRALSVDGSKVKALVALGRMEVMRGRLEEALDYLRTAQQLKPRPELHRYIASIEAAQ